MQLLFLSFVLLIIGSALSVPVVDKRDNEGLELTTQSDMPRPEKDDLKDSKDDLKDSKDDLKDSKDDLKDIKDDRKDDIKDDRKDSKDDRKDDRKDSKDDLKDIKDDRKDDRKDSKDDRKDIKDDRKDIKDDRKDTKDDIKDDRKDDIKDDGKDNKGDERPRRFEDKDLSLFERYEKWITKKVKETFDVPADFIWFRPVSLLRSIDEQGRETYYYKFPIPKDLFANVRVILVKSKIPEELKKAVTVDSKPLSKSDFPRYF